MPDDDSSDYLFFWGKARPSAPPPAPRFHPIAYHLLDVAAVLEAILVVRPLAARRAARLLRLPEEDAKHLLVALAGLHDLGKFAPAFQAKAPALWPEALRPLTPERALPGIHTADGLVLWTDEMDGIGEWATERLWPGADAALLALAPAIFGHHGRPVREPNGGARQRFKPAALNAARKCAGDILTLLAPEPLRTSPLKPRDARVASWWVAGLMTTADWIGSGAHWFPYSEPLSGDGTLAEYWQTAQQAARRAVRESGLEAPSVAPRRSFAELTRLDRDPTPAQHWAETVRLPDGPCLVVIEDVTGSGKTEAAQVIVHRLLVDQRAAGAYWAMPTQATANAMYTRQTTALDRLYGDDTIVKPSLVLAHGQQRLHEGFRSTVLDGAAGEPSTTQSTSALSAASADDGASTVTCAAFLADDRRAALLADIGAGTVDQALLGVLPCRFNAMRLFGLAGKVLVVDEAHAYDAYMGIEVQELLRFHAALGGSAIVLSATLPQIKRRALAEAWLEGLTRGGWRTAPSGHDGDLLYSDRYPLATLVGADGVREEPLGTAPWSTRKVSVRLVHTVEDALAHAAHLADQGAAVAWIRNTVDDCLDAATRLREMGVEKVLVFHARLAQCDRQSREQMVLERFGREAIAAARAGWVLVATQVVEQSLDLDFDAMLSDVAPIDLLIQRAGRLWRHTERDPSRPPACVRQLVVLSPTPDADPPKEWLEGIFAGSAAVYRNAGVLWRTVRILSDFEQIDAPSGLRALIEGVYGVSEAPPDGLLAATQRAEGKETSSASIAQYGTLKIADGYDASGVPWLNELHVPTRLGDEQTTIRLARVRPDGTLAPWADDVQPAWKAWALSEIRIRAARVPSDAGVLPGFEEVATAARRTWGRYEQEEPILPLEEDSDEPGTWHGALIGGRRTREIRVRYSTSTGLAFDE